MPQEVDVTLDRDELVDAYGSELPLSFCRGFLVDLVALVDAWMEEVFEQVLPVVRSGLSAIEIERKVKSAWTDDNGMPAIRRMFLVELALKTPSGRVSTPDMVFDRYEEMRELRHATMHTDGRLAPKHVAKLSAIRARFPANPPKGASTMADGFLPQGLKPGSEVCVGAIELLTLRKWAFESVGYFRAAFDAS